MDWPTVASDAIKIGVPAALTGLVTFFASRRQFAMEKWKLQHGDCVAANKRLFVFAQQLQGRMFPLADSKEPEFIELMEEQYFTSLQADAVHISEAAAKILARCEEIYHCATKPELIPETKDVRRKFFDDLFDEARKMAEEARAGANQ